MSRMVWCETCGTIPPTSTLIRPRLLTEKSNIRQCGIYSKQFARRPTVTPLPTVIAQIPPRPHLSTNHRMARLGEKALLRLSKRARHGQVVVLSQMEAQVFRHLLLHRAVDVALAVAPRHVIDVVHEMAAVALQLVVGVVVLRRNVLLPDGLHKNLSPGPSTNYDA